MTRQLIMFALLGVALLVGGCTTHQPKPEDAKTTVYRHGFDAVQITKIPPDWSGTGKEISSTCLWSQLAKSSIDDRYYCPPDGSIESLKTKRDPMIITGAYKDSVIPAAADAAGTLGGAAIIMHGLRGSGTRVNQSVNGTQTNIPVFESPGTVIKR